MLFRVGLPCYSEWDKELTEALRVAEGGAEGIGDSNAVIEKWGKYKEALGTNRNSIGNSIGNTIGH